MLHVVTYTGPFAFMKPWTAVRDGKTNSLQFLTPSTLEGIRRKLGVTAVLRHKLTYAGVDWQQEMTHPRDWVQDGRQRLSRPRAVLERGVLLNPVLRLALASAEEAAWAGRQHVCLSRNEDVLLPSGPARICSETEFAGYPGFELLPATAETPGAFLVGHNRYAGRTPMYGQLVSTLAAEPAGVSSFFSAE